MLIFLVGYMGSGKTVLGRQLAAKLGYRFLDMDEMIEISTGYSVDAFFRKFGEPAFRLKERELLLDHLSELNCVIATGGGTPCYEDNMDRMNAAGVTVYLETGHDTILERLRGKINRRPLLDAIPASHLPEFIKDHLNFRRVYYERARIRINGESPDLDDLCGLIARHSPHAGYEGTYPLAGRP
jgi:shikimate kinase